MASDTAVNESISAKCLQKNTFFKFPKLAAELRLMIWKESPLEPQIVTIHHDKLYDHATASYKLDPLLQTDREAIEVARAIRKLEFGKNLDSIPVYFDFTRDAIVFTDRCALRTFFQIASNASLTTSKVPLRKQVLFLGCKRCVEHFWDMFTPSAYSAIGSPKSFVLCKSLPSRVTWIKFRWIYRDRLSARKKYNGPPILVVTLRELKKNLVCSEPPRDSYL